MNIGKCLKTSIKHHLLTTAGELYLFKGEEIREKTETYPEAIIGEVLRNQSRTSTIKLFAKIIACI